MEATDSKIINHQNKRDVKSIDNTVTKDNFCYMKENSKMKMFQNNCFKSDHGFNKNGLNKQFALSNKHNWVRPNDTKKLIDRLQVHE